MLKVKLRLREILDLNSSMWKVERRCGGGDLVEVSFWSIRLWRSSSSSEDSLSITDDDDSGMNAECKLAQIISLYSKSIIFHSGSVKWQGREEGERSGDLDDSRSS